MVSRLYTMQLEMQKKTNFFDEVVVSTENFEIAKYAKSQGAKIHLRSKKLAKDNVKLKVLLRM